MPGLQRLRQLDDAAVRWVLAPRVRPQSFSNNASDRLARRHGWRWVPTAGIGVVWGDLVLLLVWCARADISATDRELELLGWLLLAWPSLARPPHSLRRVEFASAYWWLLTLLFLPAFGIGLLAAPAAAAALISVLVGLVATRPKHAA